MNINFYFLLSGFFLGILITLLSFYLVSLLKKIKFTRIQNKIFTQILDSLDSEQSNFNNRVNQVIQIDTVIPTEGNIQIMVFLDKKDISVFKGTQCVYTSEVIDSDLIDKINAKIWSRFSLLINDVIYLQNNIIDRQTYIRLSSNNQPKKKVKKDLTLDEVLDKINIIGYDNLTDKEKEFLKNCGK